MTNKPAPLGGRILAAVLDLILIYILVIIATAIISVTPLGETFNTLNSEYETMYNSYALKEGYGVWVDVSGVSSLSFVNNSSIISRFQSAALQDSHFVDVMKETKNYYLIINLIAVTVVEVLYLFLVPFLNKKGQTVGKMITGLGVIDANNDTYLTSKQKLIRFAVGFGVETILMMILFQNNLGTVLFMSPLIVLMTIMISPRKQSLHDIASHSKVVDIRSATIFETVEEKEAYDATLRTGETSVEVDEDDKEVIDGEIVEIPTSEVVEKDMPEETVETPEEPVVEEPIEKDSSSDPEV